MAEQTQAPAKVSKFKTKKKLTLPTFKLEKSEMLALLVAGEIHRGVQRGQPKKRPDGTDEEPPMLMHVVNMDTGEHGQIMVAKIIETELTERYPALGYIGRAFGIMKGERKPGKRYDPYEIDELEIPDELKESAATFAKEAKAEAEKKIADAKAAAEKESGTATPPATPPAGEAPTKANARK